MRTVNIFYENPLISTKSYVETIDNYISRNIIKIIQLSHSYNPDPLTKSSAVTIRSRFDLKPLTFAPNFWKNYSIMHSSIDSE